MNGSSRTPFGCDTFVAFPPVAPQGSVVFGKNSDRPRGEGQSIQRYPAVDYPDNQRLKCTYIEIPQVSHTHAVLLSQIDWMWGAEHGANEYGVVIGNEAVWTKVEDESLEEERLLGMDLVRLGLERGATAVEAMEDIVGLLETHGQGGACAENDSSFTYHNSFMVVDHREAWVLETAGRHWVAQKIKTGSRNLSNALSIRSSFDRSSEGLHDYARSNGLWDGHGALDWAMAFGENAVEECENPNSRFCGGRRLLQVHSNCPSAIESATSVEGLFDYRSMMDILRNHDAGICMHGEFETTASMVTEWKDSHPRHFLLDRPHPCKKEYVHRAVKLS